MKKFAILSLSFLTLAIISTGGIAHAVDPYEELCQTKPDASVCIQQKTDPISGTDSLINKVVNILTIVAGVIAVVMVMVGGLQMITSSGDSEKFARSRKTLIFAGAGLLIIMLARVLVAFILSLI